MSRQIMSGDEAVARGVYEAGATVAAAYPGTPSTEILENIGALYKSHIYSQWATNEKVAFEIAAGASIGGARAFAAFKHVGMNVAADPIFTMGYAGVGGGLVFVTADDPGCHSSQNEQDNRLYAPHSRIAMLEPSDSAECLQYTKAAFDLSERFDTPVMIRMTTRVCHSKSIVETGEREDYKIKKYERNPQKFAMLPANARVRHRVREELLKKLEEYSCVCGFNRVEEGGETGVITSGISYMHAREVFGDSASYLKLGLTYPLPRALITDFCKNHKTLYVIEENDPYLENAVRELGFDCTGKQKLPITGELDAGIIRRCLFGGDCPPSAPQVPPRAPTLCAGCPHRGFYYALSSYLRQGRIVSAGDIGCYTLGVAPPLSGIDYCICMGAGFSTLIGLEKALSQQGDTRRPLGVLGDSTFFHSGITALIDIVAAQANVIAVVLDNSITAMTGHQQNPGTPLNLMGEPSPVIDIERIVRATGLSDDNIRVVDPIDIEAVRAALNDALAQTGPFVIITKRPCALIKEVARAAANVYCEVVDENCRGCKACMKIACPAISFENKKAAITDRASCNACGLCASVCSFGAIEKRGV